MLTVLETKNDLRSSIESADQVGGDLIVPRKHGAAKVSQLDHSPAGTDQDVVRLDISVQDSTVAQVVQGDQHLG